MIMQLLSVEAYSMAADLLELWVIISVYQTFHFDIKQALASSVISVFFFGLAFQRELH